MKTTSELSTLRGLVVLPRSVVVEGGVELGLARTKTGWRLVVLARANSPLLKIFEGDPSSYKDRTLLVGPANTHNLSALRDLLPWLHPRTLGLRTSAGMGDRLGLATSGHVRAVRSAGGDLSPIFAQQSIREMERTGRSPQQVIDDAAWGIFAEGWRSGFGADADHLKTFADVDACVAAGYTFYTIDPGEYVDDSAEAAWAPALRATLNGLPWDELEDSPSDLKRRYLDMALAIEGNEIYLDELAISRAAVKYGRAVAHVAKMYRYLEETARSREFEVEVSVDETTSPTTQAQHIYIAVELQRLGVRWVSLAPRYAGRFEKGVDYIGDVAGFEADFAVHAAIARRFGPYKLSLHSGSDKFSIYPSAVRQTRGLIHLKTAGTSYLEALRTVATLDPEFFRALYAFARERYEKDRTSYHVSANLSDAPSPGDVSDSELPGLLAQFDTRQILHVTFGSVLKDRRLRSRLYELLRDHPDAYAANLEAHFLRHLEPFAKKPKSLIGDSR